MGRFGWFGSSLALENSRVNKARVALKNREAWTVPYTATGLQGEKPLVSEIK
jgi:hypothetical protein